MAVGWLGGVESGILYLWMIIHYTLIHVDLRRNRYICGQTDVDIICFVFFLSRLIRTVKLCITVLDIKKSPMVEDKQ